jgi:hypothetical protein
MLLIADIDGHLIGLDTETGQRVGPDYTLKAGAAPSATPVAFGKGRALVPLTDGTLFVFALDQLRADKKTE